MIARRHTTRPGLTLVEVLVAAALCILIMTVMAYAFQQGMDTFSLMKSTGDLQERLRSVEVVLRDDLKADHLESDAGPRVSDQRMDLVTPSASPTGSSAWKPPRGGFFRIVQESNIDLWPANPTPPSPLPKFQLEGSDQDGILSTRATDHILHMSVRRSADKPERMFRTAIPNTPGLDSFGLTGLRSSASEFVSPWAEVAYFLDLQNPTGTTPAGLTTYPLVRRVRVMATGTSGVSWQANRTNNPDLSYSPLTSATTPAAAASVDNPVNGPDEIANPNNRLGGMRSSRTAAAPMALSSEALQKQSGTAMGNDVLLTNVISFEVRATWDGGTTAPRNFTPEPPRLTSYPATAHTDTPFDDIPAAANSSLNGTRVFDTWWQQPDDTSTTTTREDENWRTSGNANCVPSFIRLKAVQIKVRVWDSKNQMARQITIIQDM